MSSCELIDTISPIQKYDSILFDSIARNFNLQQTLLCYGYLRESTLLIDSQISYDIYTICHKFFQICLSILLYNNENDWDCDHLCEVAGFCLLQESGESWLAKLIWEPLINAMPKGRAAFFAVRCLGEEQNPDVQQMEQIVNKNLDFVQYPSVLLGEYGRNLRLLRKPEEGTWVWEKYLEMKFPFQPLYFTCAADSFMHSSQYLNAFEMLYYLHDYIYNHWPTKMYLIEVLDVVLLLCKLTQCNGVDEIICIDHALDMAHDLTYKIIKSNKKLANHIDYIAYIWVHTANLYEVAQQFYKDILNTFHYKNDEVMNACRANYGYVLYKLDDFVEARKQLEAIEMDKATPTTVSISNLTQAMIFWELEDMSLYEFFMNKCAIDSNKQALCQIVAFMDKWTTPIENIHRTNFFKKAKIHVKQLF